VRLYAFLSQVMPFTDPDLEKLYAFGRYLELKLPRDEKKAPLALEGEVALRYYRLDKINEGQIGLTFAEPVALRSPADLGTRQAKDEQAALSEVIDVLNERFGTQFDEADQLLFDQFIAEAERDRKIVDGALANALDNFELAMKPKVEGLMLDRMDQNQEIVNRYLNDPEFQMAAFKALVRKIYEDIRRGVSQPPASR
jgi:type I restriction enzyme R subunit